MFDADNKSSHIDSSRDVSGMRESAKVKRSHKVRVGDKLFNEYAENPQLNRGAFAAFFPLGLIKEDLGKGGPLYPKVGKHG